MKCKCRLVSGEPCRFQAKPESNYCGVHKDCKSKPTKSKKCPQGKEPHPSNKKKCLVSCKPGTRRNMQTIRCSNKKSHRKARRSSPKQPSPKQPSPKPPSPRPSPKPSPKQPSPPQPVIIQPSPTPSPRPSPKPPSPRPSSIQPSPKPSPKQPSPPQPVIIQPSPVLTATLGLEQSLYCIVGDLNKFTIGIKNCTPNMCLYYAIFHVLYKKPYQTEYLMLFLNNLLSEGLITTERKFTEYVDITEDYLVPLMNKFTQRILFVTFIQNQIMVLEEHPFIPGQFAYLPLSMVKNIPWMNDQLMVVANVMGKRYLDKNYDDVTLNSYPNHYIALKLNRSTNEAEIIDSIYKTIEGEVKVPIDRLRDPIVYSIINDLMNRPI